MVMRTHQDKPSRAASERELPVVVDLRAPASLSVELVGAKAASLSRSARSDLPVLPGFVLTTALDPSLLDAPTTRGIEASEEIRRAWRDLTGDGRDALVVRSSATKEDSESSSMAGLFVSKLDVRGWDAFVAATRDVLASTDFLAGDGTELASDVEMAVLVQPYLVPAWGGVLFGAEPVSDRTDRMVISAVRGGPDRLVGGEVDGWTATLTRKGRIVETATGDHPDERHLRELAALARRLERLNGRPQDIEWAIDGDGIVRLLQSRPITTLHGPVGGPLYGPGPLAETFPDAMAPLEEDLWLDPLRDGLRHALGLLGTSAPGRLKRAPLVVSVGGRPAVDLVLLGADPRRRSVLRRLDPRPSVRRLRAAWRVGRLGVALPDLAHDLIAEIDDDLLAVPALDDLTDAELLRILRNTASALRALHGYEMLAGALLDADPSVGVAGLALDALQAAGGDDVTAGVVVARVPIVLALIPPRIPPIDAVPDVGTSVRLSPSAHAPTLEGITREALRMRVRWVHELSARAAAALGTRLARAGVLPDAEAIRYLRRDELEVVLRTRQPFHPDGRPDAMRRTELPAVFRLAADGTPVASGAGLGGTVAGTPVGGGQSRGVVRFDVADAGPGVVLVVRALDPRLAPVIPRLAGLVAETGSPLSHLAILAREYGVPTVVGKAGAIGALHEGDVVDIDGSTGAVVVVNDSGAAGAVSAGPARASGASRVTRSPASDEEAAA
jgi:phosphohistidine swiveling domain-containing protein